MRYQIRHAIVKYAADTILEDVNFEIHDHEKIAIIGRNGCGKTTLLRILGGFLKQNEGEVIFGDQEITNVEPYKWQENSGSAI